MARIETKTIKKIDKDRNNVHTRVQTTYTVFDYEGRHYVQIDTYGKSDRDMPEKISQSLQFDYESAKYLIDLLRDEFNIE